jgi:hypothetical protein
MFVASGGGHRCDAAWVEDHGPNRRRIPSSAHPSFWISFARPFVEGVSGGKALSISPMMAFVRSDIADGAVSVPAVVPRDEALHPSLSAR